MMQRLLPATILAAGLIALAACSGGGEAQWHGHDITGVMPDLAYQLTDENGADVSAGTYAGKVRVVFFGYTHCPKICPVTMSRVAGAISKLPAGQRDDVRVLFVSVDPERDPPQRLKEWTDNFGPRFIGMTGTQEQLKRLNKRYRVTYSYGKPNDSGFYKVNHSSGVFVFGPDGKARLLINQNQTADDIAADLKRLLEQTG